MNKQLLVYQQVKETKLVGDMEKAYAYVGGCKIIFSFITINPDRSIFKHDRRPYYDRGRNRWEPTVHDGQGLMVSAGTLAEGVEFDPTVLHSSGFWKHAPKWANYYGIDWDGDCYWYKERPVLNTRWQVWDSESGDIQLVKFGREDCEPQLYSRTMGRVK